MSIIIGADIVPVEQNIKLFENGDIVPLIGQELYDMFCNAEYIICNLETPLSDQREPIAKFGPNLIAPQSCVKGIKQLGISLVTLANNHIMDQGEQGLLSTIQELKNAGISIVGAGYDINEAGKPHYFTVENKCFGVYACAEHEFSIATERTPGANPFSPLESPDHISAAKEKCDYLIVLYHGGKEHYRYPSPLLQKVCRKMVEKGADLVICQHSHCIGCQEKYNNGIIVYGQGNFLFPQYENEYWDTSLLIDLDSSGAVSYIPIKRTACGTQKATEQEGSKILENFYMRSKQIQTAVFLEKEYDQFSKESIDYYLRYFSILHNNVLFRGINKITGYWLQRQMVRRYQKKKRLGLLNYIECEAHRELLLTGLKLGDIKKQ